MPDDRVTQVQEALSRAGALHAIARAAEEDASLVANDALSKVAEAEESYGDAEATAKVSYDAAVAKARVALEKAKDAQANRIEEATRMASQAASELSAHQDDVRKNLGAFIDLSGVPASGGHTRL